MTSQPDRPGSLQTSYTLLSHAEQIHHRQELAAVDDLVTDHLDEVLHELVGRHWLATVPPDMPPCLAASFQLRQDHEPDDGQAPGDISIHVGVGGGGGNDGDGVPLAHLGAGVTWVTGDHGSDGG